MLRLGAIARARLNKLLQTHVWERRRHVKLPVAYRRLMALITLLHELAERIARHIKVVFATFDKEHRDIEHPVDVIIDGALRIEHKGGRTAALFVRFLLNRHTIGCKPRALTL